MEDIDIWGTARKMIELYGSEAQLVAKRRGDAALARDDQKGRNRWDSIAKAITNRAQHPSASIPTSGAAGI